MTEEQKKLYDELYAEYILQGYTPEQANIMATSRVMGVTEDDTEKESGLYDWVNQLPPGFIPAPRGAREGRGGLYGGNALVDSGGMFVLNSDGTRKTMYGPDDVQGILRSLPYQTRREISNAMKQLDLYSGGKPSANVDQKEDFTAFARLLYTGNQEGLSWDAALDLIAKRSKDLPSKNIGRVYKPTNIADIKRAIQKQSTDLLGRELTPEQVKPLAQRVQQRETTVQTRGGAEQAPSTSTIIENRLKKEFKPEEEAFGIASYIEQMLQL